MNTEEQDEVCDCLQIEGTLGEVRENVKWKAAVVIQGPYTPILTERVVRIFLERNPPDVLVIVSTYIFDEEEKGENILGSSLSSFEEEVVISEKRPEYSGRLVYIFIKKPDKQVFPDFWRTNHQNQNLHRLTTFAGLNFAKTLDIEYCLKIRSEAFLGKDDVCGFLIEEISRFPLKIGPELPFSSPGKEIKGRIVICEQARDDNFAFLDGVLAYHVGDQWFFGFTSDLINYFDARKISFWDDGKGFVDHWCVETRLCLTWMRNVGINYNKDFNFRQLAARYFIMGSTNEVEFIWMKYRWHSFDKYMIGRKEYLTRQMGNERHFADAVHREDWLKWLQEEGAN